jgi:hypothetical protein
MEKETHAPTEKETPEKTGKVQVGLFLNIFACIFISESFRQFAIFDGECATVSQFLHFQIDHSCGGPEAQKNWLHRILDKTSHIVFQPSA